MLKKMFTIIEAVKDIKSALSLKSAWCFFALQDIKIRYRGSYLGPFWIVLSTLAQILTLGLLYPSIFNINNDEYILWLCTSLTIWSTFSSCINDSSYILINNQEIYNNQSIPFSFFFFRHITVSIYLLLHQIPVIVGSLFLFNVNITFEGYILSALGLLINIVCWFFLSLINSILCLKYRDMIQIVNNSISVLFFLTPIIWIPHLMPNKNWLVKFNPFYYMFSIIRSPLLGYPLEEDTWFIAILFTIFTSILGMIIFSKYRKRLPYF